MQQQHKRAVGWASHGGVQAQTGQIEECGRKTELFWERSHTYEPAPLFAGSHRRARPNSQRLSSNRKVC